MLGLISKNDLENINKPTSNYQNFLAKNNKFGIEISSTKPGYGVAQAVGIAVAEANLSNKFKEVSHFTYAFVSRKDLETGIAQEALKYAGLISLNKLIVLYDSNSFLSNFNVKKTMINNKKTYESYGFKYLKINDANYKSISKAITKAKKSNKPTIIEIKTSLQEMKIINFEGYYSRSSSLSFEQIDEFKDLTNFKKSDLFDCYIDVVNEYKKVFAKNNELFIKW
ncbi:Transketolase, partial [Metamycoplasma alkalescens]